MVTRKPNDLKKRTGAELRAMAAQRLAEATDPSEQARRALAGHENVIENARRSFVDMGRALLAIRTERLYSREYSTFAEYLEARWDVSEAYANRVINAALVAIKATPIGVEINSEAQARELADLADEPERIREVWDEATRRAAGGRVTAALIKEVRKAFDQPDPPALEGEIVDPLAAVPAAEAADAAKLADRLESTPADRDPETSPEDSAVATTGQPEEDHPGTADPGDEGAVPAASDAQPPVDDVSNDVDGDETDLAPSREDPVDPEQARDGVGAPAPQRSGGNVEQGQAVPLAPAPPSDDAEQVRREMRERMTEQLLRSLVYLGRDFGPTPEAWFDGIYLPGSYKVLGMPGVRACLTPDALRATAARIYELADYMQETGREFR